MEIFYVVLASLIIPAFVIIGLVLFRHKFQAERKKDQELIDTLEQIVEKKQQTIKKLL